MEPPSTPRSDTQARHIRSGSGPSGLEPATARANRANTFDRSFIAPPSQLSRACEAGRGPRHFSNHFRVRFHTTPRTTAPAHFDHRHLCRGPFRLSRRLVNVGASVVD